MTLGLRLAVTAESRERQVTVRGEETWWGHADDVWPTGLKSGPRLAPSWFHAGVRN